MYVSDAHTVFEQERSSGKKAPKRYGDIVAAKERGLNAMVRAHREDVWSWIEARCVGEGDETESER